MSVANTWVVGTRGWNTNLLGAHGCVEVIETCPATVEEGVESEREVRGGEDDEVEVAEEEGGFGNGGSEAESMRSHVRMLVDMGGDSWDTYGLLVYSSHVT